MKMRLVLVVVSAMVLFSSLSIAQTPNGIGGLLIPSVATPPYGFSFGSVPRGAYVQTVVPDSPASKAGLKPGMVVEAVNGHSVKGLNPWAIQSILKAAGTDLILDVGNGKTIHFTLLPRA